MGNADVKKVELGDADLYANQLKYDKYIEKKKKIYSFLYLIASVVSVFAVFTLPIFEYAVKGNRRDNTPSIMGEYTPIYIVQKYFANELGAKSILNTFLMISIILMVIIAVYTVIGAVMNLFLKKLLESNAMLNKLFNYGILEIVSTVLLILLFAAMIFCRVDVSGSAENLFGFWTICAASIVMICTSIPLSSK